MLDGIERVLTVTNYGADQDEEPGSRKTRITISPGMVLFIIASAESEYKVGGIDLYHVNVLLTNDSNLELFISLLDLDMLQRAVGMWFSPI
ncbi:hypothetical protein CCP1ISM_130021 [Azospirillaceae bacterium]